MAQSTGDTLRRLFPAMESTDYRRMFYAGALSAISLWGMLTARSWVAFDLTGRRVGERDWSPSPRSGPGCWRPFGGALADRYDRGRVVMHLPPRRRPDGADPCQCWRLPTCLGLLEPVRRSPWRRASSAPARCRPRLALLAEHGTSRAALLSAITLASMMQFGSRVIGPVAGPVLERARRGLGVSSARPLILGLSAFQMTRIKVRSTGGIVGNTSVSCATPRTHIKEGTAVPRTGADGADHDRPGRAALHAHDGVRPNAAARLRQATRWAAARTQFGYLLHGLRRRRAGRHRSRSRWFRLRSDPGKAFCLWWGIASGRGADPASALRRFADRLRSSRGRLSGRAQRCSWRSRP